MITGAIFDMDGVLLDSMPVWENAGAIYLEKQGKKAEPGLAEVLFTKTMLEAAEYMRVTYQLAKSAPELVEDIIAVILSYYEEIIPIKAGVLSFVKQLKEQGIAVTVATSSDRALAEAGLSRVGVLPYIDSIFTCGEVGIGKEKSPLVYQKAQEYMGTKTKETWVFEDAAHAIITARRAGFKTVGVYDAASAKNQERIQLESDIYLEDLTNFERFYAYAKVWEEYF